MSHRHGAYKASGGAVLRRKEGLPCIYPAIRSFAGAEQTGEGEVKAL